MNSLINGIRSHVYLAGVLIFLTILTPPAFGQGGPPPGQGSLAARVAALEVALAQLQNAVTQEVTDRQIGDATLQLAVDAEAASRQTADAALQASLSQEVADRNAEDVTLQLAIGAETAARQAGDAGLQGALSQEAADRQVADAAETATRQAGDAALQTALSQEVADRQADVDALESGFVPGLADYVSVIDLFRDVDRDGVDDPVPTVRFEAVNVQVVNGQGVTLRQVERSCVATDSCPPEVRNPNRLLTNGLGNVIIGYDEVTPWFRDPYCSDGTITNEPDCLAADEVWSNNQKHGVHNLVLGYRNSYSGGEGIVVGNDNVISGLRAVVIGGANNTATGSGTVVVGGSHNTATPTGSPINSFYSAVFGGRFNTANGDRATVTGGYENTSSGNSSSVVGGDNNTASGSRSSVVGGNDYEITGMCNWGGSDQEFGDFSCN